MRRTTVRYDVERLVNLSRPEDDASWFRESIADARTITAARADLAEAKREFKPWKPTLRIVRVTTTREVVR